MELREYWNIIRRRWWLPVAITLVALVASTAVGVRGAAAYKTDMRLAVSTIPTPDPNSVLYYDPTYYSNLDSEYLADDMSELLTSRAFAGDVKRELATGSTPVDVDIEHDHERHAGQKDAPLHRHHDDHAHVRARPADRRARSAASCSDPAHLAHLPQGADRLQHPDDRRHAAR